MRSKVNIAGALTAALALSLPAGVSSQAHPGHQGRISIIQMPFTGARNVPEISDNPAYLYTNGVHDTIRAMGFSLIPDRTVALTTEEDREYGSWHRMALANGHLAGMVAGNWRSGTLTVGLLGNCTSVIGVLGGLQKSSASGELRSVGLVFIDAHGDFNVPETTLSGMLGGMPVAVSAGMALHNLRKESGLDPGIPTEHIVMGAVRDLDPLERGTRRLWGAQRLGAYAGSDAARRVSRRTLPGEIRSAEPARNARLHTAAVLVPLHRARHGQLHAWARRALHVCARARDCDCVAIVRAHHAGAHRAHPSRA